MEKNDSAIKVFFCSLLGYLIINVIRTTLFYFCYGIIYKIHSNYLFFVLLSFAFFSTLYLGYFVSEKIADKIFRTDDALRRYNRNIGLLFIINYLIFIIDYFIFKEGSLYFYIASALFGIGTFFSNLKNGE